jgi:hypothetical protein
VADVVTRLNVSQNTDGTIRSTVIVATGSTTVAYNTGVFTITTPENAFGNANVGIIVSRVSNALTFYLQTRSLATPTAANPAQIPFRSTPVTTGSYDLVNVTSGLSLVISSGSSVGIPANHRGRIYIGAVNNAGTVELTAHNPLTVQVATRSSYSLWKPNESVLQDTTAEGGAGGADSAGVLYSASARSQLPYRMLGYFDILMGGSAGTYSSDPTAIQVWGPGIPRTGELIQRVATITDSLMTGTTAIPQDNTVPQQAEGDRYLSATITATNAANLMLVELQLMSSIAAGSRNTMAVFRYGEANAFSVSRQPAGSAILGPCALAAYSTITTTSAVGFQVRAGDSAGATFTLNGESSAALIGGVLDTHLYLSEICT